MSGRLSYFEHVGKGPELDLVEFQPGPEAEVVALRIALQRTADERDYWRTQFEQLQVRVRRLAFFQAAADVLRPTTPGRASHE